MRIALKGRLSPYELLYHVSFALRVTPVAKESSVSTTTTNAAEQWLHPTMTMDRVRISYGSIDELKYARGCCRRRSRQGHVRFRFDLRLRYFPPSLDTLSHDKPTFGYFYEQVDAFVRSFASSHAMCSATHRLHALQSGARVYARSDRVGLAGNTQVVQRLEFDCIGQESEHGLSGEGARLEKVLSSIAAGLA